MEKRGDINAAYTRPDTDAGAGKGKERLDTGLDKQAADRAVKRQAAKATKSDDSSQTGR